MKIGVFVVSLQSNRNFFSHFFLRSIVFVISSISFSILSSSSSLFPFSTSGAVVTSAFSKRDKTLLIFTSHLNDKTSMTN
ncbi:hypothetical protein RchiOBHm_Chr2g0159151 [Rosa chinensis]|uniref:Uncharacterized protein n=1 Tax=Rosa chinensis TaxID=74649 RepID=A0A2P6S274_ROSCH|nr:hypothetical protein RchiOBHm_Chr2g0159151 [Rosa chinensis]